MLRSIIMIAVIITVIGAMCASVRAVEIGDISIYGYMQNRIYAGPGANPEFRSERISLSAKKPLLDDGVAYVEVYYHPWASSSGLYLESAYVDLPLADGRLRVGKGRRLTFGMTPAYPNRKTSNYGIVSEAFTQDRIQGIQYVVQKGVLDLGVSVQTGYRLGTRAIGEIPGDTVRNANHQVQHLSFRDVPGDLSRKPEASARVGGKWGTNLTAGVSYSVGSLDPRDLASLTSDAKGPLNTAGGPGTALLPAGTTSNTRNVLGIDAMYKLPSGFVVQGEFYDATAGGLDYSAWNALVGQVLPSGWKIFGRYGKQNMDVTPTANQLSWDVQQVSLSVVQPINKSLWIQYEYEINTEDPAPGIPEVSNNLFFVELFTLF